MSGGGLVRLAIRVRAADADLALAQLLPLLSGGAEERAVGETVEYALYGAPGELPSLPEGEAEVGGVRVSVRGEEVPEDWEERWKRFHAPVLIAGKVYVRPPAETAGGAAASSGTILVVPPAPLRTDIRPAPSAAPTTRSAGEP